jgi:hypothetical protein
MWEDPPTQASRLRFAIWGKPHTPDTLLTLISYRTVRGIIMKNRAETLIMPQVPRFY